MNTGTEGGRRPAWAPVTMRPGALANFTSTLRPAARLTPLLLILGLSSCFLLPNTWFGAQPLGVDTWTLEITGGLSVEARGLNSGDFGKAPHAGPGSEGRCRGKAVWNAVRDAPRPGASAPQGEAGGRWALICSLC